jgi:hypothetical protein
MYSWVNILLEEAALSRKKSKKQFHKSGLFYTLPDGITSECPNFENLFD